MIKVLPNIKERCLILKVGKRHEIVLINEADYHNSMRHLSSDTSNFKILQHNPTLHSN